jgi:EAL domain-containing protein (putative c-di-GMP-specific phosphodiesterase class I)
LKTLGVRLAVDDFGTGYSSLSYLARFPVDVLKIDRSFVEHVGGESDQAELARTIVQLGRTLRLRTVAEGIEHPDQARHLAGMGCDLGQGYLYARPMPAGDLEELLGAAMTNRGPVLAGAAVGGAPAGDPSSG